MKSKLFWTVLLALCLPLIAALPLQAQSAPPEPLIYEGIAFPELPYASRWIEVNGAKMHYMETGDPAGTPILLLHGNPTWSYLWRDVMPHLEDSGRVIAVDLIGMGLSDKPDIAYTFAEHREYLWRFIELLGLQELVLVVHDWGSGLGFDYAYQHQDNVQGIAFMEALIAPFPAYADMPQGGGDMMQTMRGEAGRGMILNQNFFVEQLLPGGVVRELSAAELDAYRAPFPTPESRLPVLMWPRQIPIGGEPAEVHAVLAAYAAWLPQSETPKLLLYAEPGMMTQAPVVAMLLARYQNLETVNVGAGGHFIQEDQPDAIGQSIAEWMERVIPTG